METEAFVPELFRVPPLFAKLPLTTREAPAELVSPPLLFSSPATVSTDAVEAFWIGPDDDSEAPAATVNLPLLVRVAALKLLMPVRVQSALASTDTVSKLTALTPAMVAADVPPNCSRSVPAPPSMAPVTTAPGRNCTVSLKLPVMLMAVFMARVPVLAIVP